MLKVIIIALIKTNEDKTCNWSWFERQVTTFWQMMTKDILNAMNEIIITIATEIGVFLA